MNMARYIYTEIEMVWSEREIKKNRVNWLCKTFLYQRLLFFCDPWPCQWLWNHPSHGHRNSPGCNRLHRKFISYCRWEGKGFDPDASRDKAKLLWRIFALPVLTDKIVYWGSYSLITKVCQIANCGCGRMLSKCQVADTLNSNCINPYTISLPQLLWDLQLKLLYRH
jgi:hypothetical protein